MGFGFPRAIVVLVHVVPDLDRCEHARMGRFCRAAGTGGSARGQPGASGGGPEACSSSLGRTGRAGRGSPAPCAFVRARMGSAGARTRRAAAASRDPSPSLGRAGPRVGTVRAGCAGDACRPRVGTACCRCRASSGGARSARRACAGMGAPAGGRIRMGRRGAGRRPRDQLVSAGGAGRTVRLMGCPRRARRSSRTVVGGTRGCRRGLGSRGSCRAGAVVGSTRR